MTLAELIKEFVDSSRERIKTPITGSFLMAFLLWNWRPILILMFSKATMEDKIVVINHEYCHWSAFFGPLVLAILYVGGIQYIMWAFDYLTTKANNSRSTYKYARRLHDLTEYSKVLDQQRTNEDIRSGNRDVQMLNDTIANLNQQVDTLQQQSQTTVENQQRIIDGYKENELVFKTQIQTLQERLLTASDNQLNLNSLYTNEVFDKILSNFTNDEIADFQAFAISKMDNLKPWRLNIHLAEKLRNEKLLLIEKGTYDLTLLGQLLFIYLNQKSKPDSI